MKHVFIAAITAGMMALSVGCESKSDMGGTTGGSSSGSGKNAKKNSADGEGLGNSQADDGTAPKTEAPATETPVVDPNATQAQTPAAQTPAAPAGTGTIAEKYKNVPRMTAAEKAQLVEQGYVKIDNRLKVAIVSANGQALTRIVPPGEQLMAGRNFNFNQSSTSLTLTTDDGRTCYGEFDPMSVAGNFEARQMGDNSNPADWRASVEDQNGNCVIKENAGGGGGNAGAGFK